MIATVWTWTSLTSHLYWTYRTLAVVDSDVESKSVLHAVLHPLPFSCWGLHDTFLYLKFKRITGGKTVKTELMITRFPRVRVWDVAGRRETREYKPPVSGSLWCHCSGSRYSVSSSMKFSAISNQCWETSCKLPGPGGQEGSDNLTVQTLLCTILRENQFSI